MAPANTIVLPPGGLQDIVFSFDTTGSMSDCIAQVKGRLQDMMQRLQADIPGIRIAVIAHGDYCDEDVYVTRSIDFTRNIAELCKFVEDTVATHGGDYEECYELVLREVQTQLSWSPGSQRALVMVGDAIPHTPTYHQNTQNIDWKEEVKSLKNMGVKIYSVQCNKNQDSSEFFGHMATETNGKHLSLNQFGDIFDFLMAICYREHGAEFLQTYEKEVRARQEPVSRDLDGMFGALRSADSVEVAVEDISDAGSACSPEADKSDHRRGTKRKSSELTPVVHKKLKRTRSVEKVAKCNREDVPQTKFSLRSLKWSSWKLAMVGSVPRGTRVWWVGRGEARPGFRRDTLFRGDFSVPAVYEVSVQPYRGARRHVVFSKFMTGRKAFRSWETCLFTLRDIQAQIDKVLESRCTIYIRRAMCPQDSVRSTGKQLTRDYDYAWRRIPHVRDSHRDVRKNDKSISSASL